MRSLFLIIATFLTFQVQAESIDGRWQDKNYSFHFWTSDVDGYWGDLKYDLNFWTSDIDGVLASGNFDVNFWSSDIDGILPCGSFDINIWSSDLEGHICGQQFDIDIPRGTSGKEMAFQMILEQVLSYIPMPARQPIHIRINQERVKRKWMMDPK